MKSKDAYMLIYTRRSPSTQDAAAKDQPEPPALAKLKVDELSTALEHEAEEWELKCVCLLAYITAPDCFTESDPYELTLRSFASRNNRSTGYGTRR